MVFAVSECALCAFLGIYVSDIFQYLVFAGLFFFAVGNGMLIPNVSAFLGDQFLAFEVRFQFQHHQNQLARNSFIGNPFLG
jgi:dipeptide/tripeptide permease